MSAIGARNESVGSIDRAQERSDARISDPAHGAVVGRALVARREARYDFGGFCGSGRSGLERFMRDSASWFRFSDPRPHTRKKRPGRCGPSRSPTQAWPVNPETNTMQRLGLSILFTSGLLAGAAATADGR